ncbi:MAG: hypothetical protein JWM05_1169, partial [Acidimicrobiales bacterium]|nr:hypothetical protein [Acidimicrobiales bacterium]
MFATVVASEAVERERAINRLEAEMAELSGVVNAVEGRRVRLVAEALEQGLWQQWGIHSPAHWVAWQLGLSAGHAGQIVAVARRAKDLPCAVA